MLNSFLKINSDTYTANLFSAFAIILLGSIFIGVATNFYYLVALPLAVIIGYIAVVDFKQLFFFTLLFIPFSIEMELPGGLATDFPSEGMVVGLMLVYLLYFLSNLKTLNAAFFKHPITLLIILHLVWIFITTIHSHNLLVSVKWLLAKFWYVVVFYFLAGLVLKDVQKFKTFFWCTMLPLLAIILYVIARHSVSGFSFKEINFVVGPFYRNHVMYGCIVSLFVPFIWYALKWYPRWSTKWLFLVGAFLISLLAVQLSYTRAAYIALILAVGANFIIRLRLMKIAIGLAIVLSLAFVIHLVTDNSYMDYAPEYKTTVSHTNFDNLVSATAEGKDISTMERVYRWVAGYQMSKAEPLTGFGPGNFYNFYKKYTVTSFKTYVSDNPEQSGIHNYYLMLVVEQGFIGAFIFLLLCFWVLLKGENIYHNTKDTDKKNMVMAVLLSLIIIDCLLLINDMLETDKIGTYFFICMAVLVNIDIENKKLIFNKKSNPTSSE